MFEFDVVFWVSLGFFGFAAETLRLMAAVRHRRRPAAMAVSSLVVGASIASIVYNVGGVDFSAGNAAQLGFSFLLGMICGLLAWRRTAKPPMIPSKYLGIYLTSWVIIYIAFPAWYWFQPVEYSWLADVPFYEQSHIIQLAFACWFVLSTVFIAPQVWSQPRGVSAWNLRQLFRDHLVFFLFAGLFLVLQMPNLFSAVEIGGDELVHLSTPLRLVEMRLRSGAALPEYSDVTQGLRSLRWAVIVLGGLVLLIGLTVNKPTIGRSALIRVARSNYLPFLAGLMLLLTLDLSYSFFSQFYPNGDLFRFAPLSRIVRLVLYACLGIHEFPIRFLQLVFVIGSAGCLYGSIKLFFDRWVALTASVILLFSTIQYRYLRLAYIDSGTLFFMISPVFFFSRYLKNGRRSDVAWSFLLVGVGATYKRPVLIILVLLIVGIVAVELRRSPIRGRLGQISAPPLLGLSLAVPWFLTSSVLVDDNYLFTPGNYLSLEKLAAYPHLLWTSQPMFVTTFSVIGVGIGLWSRYRNVAILFLSWFGIVWLFLTGMRPSFVPYFRLSVWLIPPLAFFAAIALVSIARRAATRVGRAGSPVVPFTCCLFLSLVCLTYAGRQIRSFPYVDESRDAYGMAAQFLREEVPHGYRIYTDFDASFGSVSFDFHRLKYGLPRLVSRKLSAQDYENSRVEPGYFDAVYGFLDRQNVLYAVFNKMDAWEQSEDRQSRFFLAVSKAVERLSDPRFESIGRFGNDSTTVYVFELRSRDQLAIRKATEQKRWSEIPDQVLAALADRSITSDFAQRALHWAEPQLSNDAAARVDKAWKLMQKGDALQGLAVLSQARSLGLSASRFGQSLVNHGVVVLDTVSERAAAGAEINEPLSREAIVISDFFLEFGEDIIRPGQVGIVNLYFTDISTDKLDIVWLMDRKPFARHSLDGASIAHDSATIRYRFPVKIPRTARTGTHEIQVVGLRPDQSDCGEPVTVGTVFVGEDLDRAHRWRSRQVGSGESPGILQNGGFENGFQSWKVRPSQWEPFGVVSRIDDEMAFEGNRALHVEFLGGADPGYYDVTQVVDLQPSTRYRLSFSTRSENLISSVLPVIRVALRPTGEILTSDVTPGTTSWVRKTIEFGTGSVPTSVEIRIFRPGASKWCDLRHPDRLIRGSLFFDDFSLAALKTVGGR